MGIWRRRSQLDGQIFTYVHTYNVRFPVRRSSNRNPISRYIWEQRRLTRELFAYYCEMDMLEHWTKNSCKIICIIVFLFCMLGLVTSFSCSYIFLLKLAMWSSYVVLVSSVLGLCIFARRKKILNGIIRRTWKSLNRGPPRSVDIHSPLENAMRELTGQS